MTEKELDRLMRQVLIDAAKPDQTSRPGPAFRPSRAYQRQVRAMLRDPLRWSARRSRPALSPVMRQAAMFALVTVLGLAATIVSVPSARAAVVRWVEERIGTSVIFDYIGEQDSPVMPEYEITALPTGFFETYREQFDHTLSIEYENDSGDLILLDCITMQDGNLTLVEAGDDEEYEIQVNQKPGKLWVPKDPDASCTVTWIDNRANIQFILKAFCDKDSILHIAESVKLVKITK